MTLEFHKYHGTGNDFIIIDNRSEFFDKQNKIRIAELCDRRFGIGADGLILLENHNSLDFKMVYYNSDGNESSMCGNGGRCIVHLARELEIIQDKATFEAIDGVHKAFIDDQLIELQMQNVINIEQVNNAIILNTGSPHYVQLSKDISSLNIDVEGAKVRFGESFKIEGINVNFVERINDDSFAIRTYERGVEGETLSCGTGVTAVALAMHYCGETKKNVVNIKTEGGPLQVSFSKVEDEYNDVWLTGPAMLVFKGHMKW